jgi:4-amino-4-deoxy-L-arabinose transferase-like glycosyltransferase
MADPPSRPPTPEAHVRLLRVLEWALGLRVLAAVLVQWYAWRRGVLCLFPDTRIYWLLAEAIREGWPYEVLQWGDNPHFALRTPGYPLFLAACRLAFGDRLMPVRLVQALLGAASVWLVYRLTAQVTPTHWRSRTIGRGWTVPMLAAALAAIDPFVVGTSALVLSEALFIPLMLATLWGLAVLWPGADSDATADVGEPGRPRRGWLWAVGAGAASGAAVLVRPSWLLCVPALPAAWLLASVRRRGRRAEALRGAILFGIGAVAVLSPWWARNARVYGRFVPTALWAGASLYDGLNPHASGASAMDEFLAAPDIWPLDEETQDAELWRRAVAFARQDPWRVLALAAIKAARYWSPWPNAEGFRAPAVAWASALYNVPLLAAMALGAWDRRRDFRALVLLAGPLVYFAALHMVFASSMRYRIPAEVPAFGLAAIGIGRVFGRDVEDASRPEGPG